MNNYIFNRKVLLPALIIILLLFGWCIKVEGWSIFEKKAVAVCKGDMPLSNSCEIYIKSNNTRVTLNYGETYIYNDHNQKNIDILNYGSLIVMLIAFMLNHYLYNRDYDFKAKFKNIKDKFEKVKINE